MKLNSRIVITLRKATALRGIDGAAGLAKITGIDRGRIDRWMSSADRHLDTMERQRLARCLAIPDEWLAAETDEEAARHEPAWSRGKPDPTPRDRLWAMEISAQKESGETEHPEVISTLRQWHVRLQRAWDSYLSQPQNNQLNHAILSMIAEPTPNGQPWPLFHRSVAMNPVQLSFSLPLQYALGQALQITDRLTYADLLTLARQSAIEEDNCQHGKTGNRATVDTFLRLAGNTSLNIFITPNDERMKWPLKTVNYGESFELLLDKLLQARDARRAKSPLETDLTPALTYGALLDDMEKLFRHRFPDDPRQDLHEVVVQYRWFVNKAYHMDEPDEGYDYGKRAVDCWTMMLRREICVFGHIYPYTHFIEYGKAWGVSENETLGFLERLERASYVRTLRTYRPMSVKSKWMLLNYPEERPAGVGEVDNWWQWDAKLNAPQLGGDH